MQFSITKSSKMNTAVRLALQNTLSFSKYFVSPLLYITLYLRLSTVNLKLC